MEGLILTGISCFVTSYTCPASIHIGSSSSRFPCPASSPYFLPQLLLPVSFFSSFSWFPVLGFPTQLLLHCSRLPFPAPSPCFLPQLLLLLPPESPWQASFPPFPPGASAHNMRPVMEVPAGHGVVCVLHGGVYKLYCTLNLVSLLNK